MELIREDDTLNQGRKKLNNAIKAFNETVVEGDSSVEAAQARVDAEGNSFSTLKERLDTKEVQFAVQLAQTESEILNVNKRVDGIDRGYGETFNTLEELEQTYPNGDDKRYVVADDGHWYFWNGTNWVSGGVFQATGLGDRTVTQEKTTFARKGKNLFNNQFLHGVIISGSTNQSYISSRDTGYSAVIKVDKNETYTLYSGTTADRHVAVATVGFPQVGGEHRLLTTFSDVKIKTVSLQGDEDHILVYLSSVEQDTLPLNFQIEKGSEFTGYESPEHVKIKLSQGSVGSYEISPGSIRPYHLAFDIGSGVSIDIESFGADVNNADNRQAIQDAIDYAHSLVNVSASGMARVIVPEGTYMVDGTLYGKSRVELVGSGLIKAANNADFDYVEWGGIARPTGGKTLYAITGTEGNPIKFSGVRGVAFDYNGENQDVEPGGSYIGIAISQAEDCWAYDATSENVMYEKIEPEETPDKMRGICLFVANAKRTNVVGGRYWKSGYDSIRIAGGAEDTKLINVFAGKAKRGAIQFTPDSNIVHLTDCTFDNREGGTSVSHAFFAHNMQNVYADGLTLLAKDGFCISFFSDGDSNRVGKSKQVNLKNVVMKNETERWINAQSYSDDYYNEDITIQGIALTTEKESIGSGHVPIYISRTKGLNLDVEIPYTSFQPISLQNVEDVEIKTKIKTDKAIVNVISLSGSLGVDNVKVQALIDAPNAQRGLNSAGTSDNVRVVDSKMNTIDSVSFPATDQNILIRDSDFREVQNADKTRLVATDSVIIDNVLGA